MSICSGTGACEGPPSRAPSQPSSRRRRPAINMSPALGLCSLPALVLSASPRGCLPSCWEVGGGPGGWGRCGQHETGRRGAGCCPPPPSWSWASLGTPTAEVKVGHPSSTSTGHSSLSTETEPVIYVARGMRCKELAHPAGADRSGTVEGRPGGWGPKCVGQARNSRLLQQSLGRTPSPGDLFLLYSPHLTA